MIAAHTPGPWAEFEPTDTLHAVRSVLGKIVADVGYSGTIEGDKANARLIAASPDLLEAIQYAINQVPELATVPGIAAAIAKATGGQS